ncbi:WXG100 family type VII secretion target [Nocardia yamanashiensis]|uniref:WXG100 family type VII secretion target n=1 Tax=Nocardia yamanashiensis TaxID=209247 RepID=UPI000830E702|nr:WXG100 family type VII secretion target [Nocardia yamanashiensis]
MAGTEINFESFGAKGVADSMADAVNAIKTTINSVTEAAAAAKGGWQGQAHTAFASAAIAWEDEADRLKGILDNITQMVGEGNTKYSTMDSDNKDYFDNLRNNATAGKSYTNL